MGLIKRISELKEYLTKGRVEYISYGNTKTFKVKRSFSEWKQIKFQERETLMEKQLKQEENPSLKGTVTEVRERGASLEQRMQPQPALNVPNGYVHVKVMRMATNVSVEYLKNPSKYILLGSKKMVSREDIVISLYKDRNISDVRNQVYMSEQEIAKAAGVDSREFNTIIYNALENKIIKQTRTEMQEENKKELIKEFGWRHEVQGEEISQIAKDSNLLESRVSSYIDTYNKEREKERTQNLLQKKKAIREKRFEKYRLGLMKFNPAYR